jgi:dethiobiotin synthetase
LVAGGYRVGVYKPAASGCRVDGARLIADDAEALWNAAERPLTVDAVCPQSFRAPLAPHLAARAEGRTLDESLLVSGLSAWTTASDIVVVEGAGGLLSPLSDHLNVADLAATFGYPIVLVADNRIGMISQALMALATARSYRSPLDVRVVVSSQTTDRPEDPSVTSNAAELARCVAAGGQRSPRIVEVGWGAEDFVPAVDWFAESGA